MGNRTYLGAGVSNTDNGRAVDFRSVIPITDPRHSLHHRCDPKRYDMRNPEFSALVDWIVANHGPVPQPVMFRRKGLLTQDDPELAYLKATYPKQVLEHPEQPKLELVYGNRRHAALLEAQRIWDERGEQGAKAKLLAVYQALSDEEMENTFVRENSARARTSIYEDQLTVRSELRKNADWAEIALLLNTPVKELRRTHEPLLEAHLAVVQAYSAGAINRSRLQRIIKVAPTVDKQVECLDDDAALPEPPKQRKRVYLDEIPLDAIDRFLAQMPNVPEHDQIASWVKTLRGAAR